jgi:DeoR/GlpR family transcriptional regulator of sugar metabolism
MTNKQRTDLIEQHIREHKYSDLHTLATQFGGSLSTVRRALDSLEERGIVRRHHGKLLAANCQPGTLNLHLAQAKCRLNPHLDRAGIYREYGFEDREV